MSEFTLNDVITALDAAVAERGADYVYPRDRDGWTALAGACVYQLADGTPACIVGDVLHRLNPELVPPPGCVNDAKTIIKDVIPEAFEADDLWNIADLLRTAQFYQDCGETWGRSAEEAKSVIGA